MKLKIEYESKKSVKKVTFEDADHIDRTKLAAAIGKTKQYASYVISTGNVPDELVEVIKKIPIKSVWTDRKMRLR